MGGNSTFVVAEVACALNVSEHVSKLHFTDRSDSLMKYTSAEDMWVSACPKSGALSAYPQPIQVHLEQALERAETRVCLGSEFFSATIFINPDGKHTQTTPAVGTKRAGIRTVLRAPVDQPVRLIECPRTRKWLLHRLDTSMPVRVRYVALPEIPTVLTWEWCQNTALEKAVEFDWLPYSEDASRELEDAWDACKSSGEPIDVTIAAGQANLVVKVDPTQPFMRQCNSAATHRCRWVRRIFRTQAHTSMMLSRQTAAISNFGDQACAICTEDFVDTPMIPFRTLRCNHTFHGACIQRMLIAGQSRCPMCRADINQTTSD